MWYWFRNFLCKVLKIVILQSQRHVEIHSELVYKLCCVIWDLSCSQRCRWRMDSCGMRHCVLGRVVPDVSKGTSAGSSSQNVAVMFKSWYDCRNWLRGNLILLTTATSHNFSSAQNHLFQSKMLKVLAINNVSFQENIKSQNFSFTWMNSMVQNLQGHCFTSRTGQQC